MTVMNVVTMGGTVEHPVEIHNPALVLNIFLTHAHFLFLSKMPWP
jgi:hypothetical protein